MVALPFCHVSLKSKRPPSQTYPEHLNTFGNYLRKTRLDLGLYQKDLARMAGLDDMTICAWEKSSEFPRRYRMVKRLCEVLDIDYENTLGRYHPLWQESVQESGVQLVKDRIRLGLNQEEMARRLRVDPTTLRRWETGKSKPTKGYLERLAGFFSSTELANSHGKVKVDQFKSEFQEGIPISLSLHF